MAARDSVQVYVNRVIHYTALALQACNWKRVLLGSILMASKVWDDQAGAGVPCSLVAPMPAVWNVDFCNMFPHIAVEDMNDLERTYLEMLQFNINVDSSVYTKYYFDLRTLAEEARRHRHIPPLTAPQNDKSFPLEPLTQEGAAKLEVRAAAVAVASDVLQALSAKTQKSVKRESLRQAKSLDLQDALANMAIIS